MDGVNLLNQSSSISLFLFSDVTFSKSGIIHEIEFVGERVGRVNVSFWRKVEQYTMVMVGKILIQSTGYGVQVRVSSR